MATLAVVPVSEYLSQTYEPDCDFVDGELEERNMGEELHAEVQGILAALFSNKRHEWGVRSLPETRVHVGPGRYRIPDLCIVSRSQPRGRIVTHPPILCVEVLSPEDRLARVQVRVNDFAQLGVQNIWVINPWERIAYYASPDGFDRVEDGVLRVPGTPIEVNLAELFAELDETPDA